MILVTGGMGFIGMHTARRLLDAGEDVVITYHRSWQEPSFIKDEYGKRVQIEKVDLANPYDVFPLGHKYKITGIAHLVVPPVGASEPPEQYRVNTMSLYHVLEAGRQWGVKRVTIASSVAVYSGLPNGPFVEDTPLRIDSASTTEAFKKAEETMALFYGKDTSLDVVSVRIAGIYGPLFNKQARLAQLPMTFIMQACRSAVDGVAMDPRYAPDGGPFEDAASDFCYVKDTGLAIATLQTADSLPNRIYNASNGRLTTMREVADAVQKVYPKAQIPLRAGGPPRQRPDAYMDTTRIRQDAGFAPEYDIDSSIADYIEWLRKNPE